MSDSFDATAHAAVSDTPVPEAQVTGAPQAESAATQADQTPETPAPSDLDNDASQDSATETPSRAAKRIEQLLSERHQDRERIARLEGILQQRPSAPGQHSQIAPRLHPDLAQWVGDEPKPDAFPAGEFDPAYLRAIAKHEARAEQAQMLMAQRVTAAQQAEAQHMQAFSAEMAKMEKRHSDAREAVGGLGNRLANWQANLVASAGAEIAYAVAKDSEAEARIRAARDPIAVAREIGRLEARMDRARETPPPQPTSAPDPAPRVVRGGNVGSRDPSKMSMSEYAEWSSKQFGNPNR